MNRETVWQLLADLGFKKRAGEVFTLEVAPDVLGWLGLNRATRHRDFGEIEINPVVGVRFQEVERLVALCRGEKFHAYQPPTISKPLGYLMPDKKYRAWVFARGNSEQVAADMAIAIATYALPFMRSVVDIAALRRQLESHSGLMDQIVYRRPVAALLAGDVEQASALLDEEMSALGARNDLAAISFKNFANSLRSRLIL